MKSNDFYIYIYPELMEKHELTLFEYSVLEILCYKSPKGTFYGDKEEHLAGVLDSSYDYVCRIVRKLIKKGWIRKKKKAVIESFYDELEVSDRWYKEVNLSIEEHNRNSYYKRFQFFPALMTEAKMTLKQYVVSLTIDILQTAKTSKIARFAGVCRQTVYNTLDKFKDYFEKAQTGVKKLSEHFKKMKNLFTEKVVNKDYRKAIKESRQVQREQEKHYQQNLSTQANPPAQEREKQIEKFIEEELKRKQEIDKEKAEQEAEQKRKMQEYAKKVYGSS
jgi:hypothetical protein